MTILDDIEESQVDIHLTVGDKDKVVVNFELFSSELYMKSSYQTLWLSFPVSNYIIEHSQYFSELYDFLDYHPDVEEHTPVYIMRYFKTTFVHPNPSYRSKEYKAVVGVVLNVRNRYRALTDLWGIYRKCLEIYEKKFINALECNMDVYWKKPKDKNLYKDYEYSYTIDSEFMEQFAVFDKYGEMYVGAKVNSIPIILAGHIYCDIFTYDKDLIRKCCLRFVRDSRNKKLYKEWKDEFVR